MTARWMAHALIGALAITLVGCDSAREMLGQGKRAPDEFMVYSRRPLSVPPSYDLRPPMGDTSRIASNEPVYDARGALVGSAPSAGAPAPMRMAAPDTPGTYALLERTGGLTADPEVRAQLNRETTILAEADQSFVERLMFWKTPTEYGTVVNPDEESQRIRENLALGKTPTIARRKRALLEGIFN